MFLRIIAAVFFSVSLFAEESVKPPAPPEDSRQISNEDQESIRAFFQTPAGKKLKNLIQISEELDVFYKKNVLSLLRAKRGDLIVAWYDAHIEANNLDREANAGLTKELFYLMQKPLQQWLNADLLQLGQGQFQNYEKHLGIIHPEDGKAGFNLEMLNAIMDLTQQCLLLETMTVHCRISPSAIAARLERYKNEPKKTAKHSSAAGWDELTPKTAKPPRPPE